MKWIIISCILCIFGCFKEFRPSESFVTNYLTGPWKNFTDDQVNMLYVTIMFNYKNIFIYFKNKINFICIIDFFYF